MNKSMKTLLTVMSVLLGLAVGSPARAAASAGEKAIASDLQVRSVVDPRVRQYITPARVAWVSSDDAVQNAKGLLQKHSGQATMTVSNPCVLDNGKGPAAVLLDFGRELHGGVQLMVWDTNSSKPVRLRVRFGESIGEAMSEGEWPNNVSNDHAIRDQTCLVPWMGTHEIGNTGFRFVRVDLAESNSMVQLKSIRAVFLYRDVEYKGSFRCSDERLNRIWDMGAYTVHLNMQDYLWDGIKRDRLVWVGDMHPAVMTIYSVFGCNDIIPASLDLVRDETELPNWMSEISSYSMWWVMIQHSWYLQNGDFNYLKKQESYLKKLVEQLLKCVGSDNKEALTGVRFLDWPTASNKDAIHAGLQSLMILSLSAGGDLCGALGDKSLREKCGAAVERLRKHIPDHGNSKQAAALMALAGLGEPRRLNEEVMAVGGAKHISTFYGYYVLEARSLAGDHQGCLDAIRQYWGGMMDLGATTFWEDFEMEWLDNAARIDEFAEKGRKDIHGGTGAYCYKGFRHSLCHSWASGPTAWLSAHVLGIRVLAPGCRVVSVRPTLGDLDWAEGTYPTPAGTISVKCSRKFGGKVQISVDAPKGIEVIR